MSKVAFWIDINLPWGRDYSVDEPSEYQTPEYPQEAVDRKVREIFGKTEEDIQVEFEEQYQKPYYNAIHDIRDEIRDRLIEENPDSNFTDEEFEDMLNARLNARLDAIESPILEAAKKIKGIKKQIKEITYNLPEVVAWSEECDRINKKRKEWEKTAYFMYSDLCRPGVLVEVLDVADEDAEEQPKPHKYLLGDTNCASGVCDDCTAFSRTAKVLRAKVLLSPEDLK